MDSDGDGDALCGGGEDGPTDGVAARASCRTIKNRPVPTSSNTALPKIEVDPDTYSVRVDGELIEHEPATELPMAQRYFLF